MVSDPIHAGAVANCTFPGCAAPSAAAFQQQTLCFDHFFARAYATLEHLEKSYCGQISTVPEPALATARVLLNECSVQALHVSMSSENLTNLDRGRLLDILLWSGELSESLRRSAKFSDLSHSRSSTNHASHKARSSAAGS